MENKAYDMRSCEKTITGKHLWAKMGGNDPKLSHLKICIACGLVDDRDLDIKKEK